MPADAQQAELATMSTADVLALRQATAADLQRRAFETLQTAVGLYIEALGAEAGCELACDDFFRHVAGKQYPGAWPGLLQYAAKAAG